MSGAQRCGRKLGKNQWAHLAFTVSEDHDHSKKDLLIGRRKDKKEKGKDRGYAALEGESSPEEELDTKWVQVS